MIIVESNNVKYHFEEIGFQSLNVNDFHNGEHSKYGCMISLNENLGKKEKADKSFSSLTQLNRRNLGRRAGRSLVTVGSMAAGAFLVVSTGAFRKAPPVSPTDLQSGTGGFSFWGESAVPIYDDLNQDEAIQ